MKRIINRVIELPGNYIDSVGRVYLSIENMKTMLIMFSEETIETESFLFTPFLINPESNALYELHYYEFEIEVSNTNEVRYIEHSKENSLPEEIVANIKPKAVVPKNSVEKYINVLNGYLYAMQRMELEEVDAYSELEQGELFFRIY